MIDNSLIHEIQCLQQAKPIGDISNIYRNDQSEMLASNITENIYNNLNSTNIQLQTGQVDMSQDQYITTALTKLSDILSTSGQNEEGL